MNLQEIHAITPNPQGITLESDGLPKRREFIFHQDGLRLNYRATVALIIDESRNVYAGVSLCSPRDIADRKLGRYVALLRARRAMASGDKPYCTIKPEPEAMPIPREVTKEGKPMDYVESTLRLLSRLIAQKCARSHWPYGKPDRRPANLKKVLEATADE